MPGIPAGLAVYWPVIYGVAFGLHQLASNFGIVPDAAFQAQVTGAVQSAESAVGALETTEATIATAKTAATAATPATPTTPAKING